MISLSWQQNPSLHVERRVGIFGNIMYPSYQLWEGSYDLEPLRFINPHSNNTQFVKRCFPFKMDICLREMYEWLEQALLLESKGMPQKAFTLTFAALPRTHRALVSSNRP